jgi:large subunit ribosomal protein L18e
MTASNPLLRQAAVMLERAAKKQKAPIWSEASRLLSGEERNRVEINVGRMSRIAVEGHALFVPGKVLGTGVMEKKLIVGAFSFSESARTKLESAGGSALSVEQFLKKYPKGSGVQIVR